MGCTIAGSVGILYVAVSKPHSPPVLEQQAEEVWVAMQEADTSNHHRGSIDCPAAKGVKGLLCVRGSVTTHRASLAGLCYCMIIVCAPH